MNFHARPFDDSKLMVMGAVLHLDYLIDGYNLLLYRRRGRLRPGPGNLERARSTLLKWLSGRTSQPERFTVVFDAAPDNGGAPRGRSVRAGPEWSIQNGIHVCFARGYTEADGLIAELCHSNLHPSRLCVVSNDRQVQEVARKSRAAWLDCASFIALLEAKPGPAGETPTMAEPSRDFPPDEKETRYWLEAFGDAPVEAAGAPEISALIQPEPVADAAASIPPLPGAPASIEDPGLKDFYRDMRLAEETHATDADVAPPGRILKRLKPQIDPNFRRGGEG